MTFTKSILLGSGAVLMAAATAQAADLPSRKAAPVEYVRVCDAYGAGFFFIPGTQTCLRIGGRVRADYAYYAASDVNGPVAAVADRVGIVGGAPAVIAGTAAVPAISAAGVPNVIMDKDAQHTLGWEARGRISFDARTQTSWGTLQTVALLRLNRTSGFFQNAAGTGASGTGTTLEAAFIRFAGFTFGAAADNFVYMPGLTYGAANWGSFASGAKQIAYTHTFGGGLSGTIALQDYSDTGNGYTADGTGLTANYVHKSIPQLVARLQWTQGWGNIALMGAMARPDFANNRVAGTAAELYDKSASVWAIGTGVTINLPMLAYGSALYLTANYANGMTEYTTRFTSFNRSDYSRGAGFSMNHPSIVLSQDAAGADRIDTVKSWNVAAMLQHFWAPQWRSVAFVSYGSLDAPANAAAPAWNGTSAFGDATVMSVGKQLAWLPVRDFEIGVEVMYSRVSQDVRYSTTAAPAAPVLVNSKQTDGIFMGRLRVERNF